MARSKNTRPRASRASQRRHVEAHRQRLFQAAGVIQVTRFAIASQLNGLDESIVLNALQVAGEIVDGVAAALEVTTHKGA